MYSLPKHCIIRKKVDFKILIEKGKTISVFPFYIKYILIEKNTTSNIKVAFTIKKRDFKKATQRNKIKRQIEEIIRCYLGQIKSGFDIVILADKITIEKDYQEIEENLIIYLKKVNYYGFNYNYI